MLDIKRIRTNTEEVKKALAKRHGEYPIDLVIELDEKRRAILTQVEEMKAEQNKASKEVPKLKKEGKDPSHIFVEMKSLSDKISQLDEEVRVIDSERKEKLLEIPNTPDESVVIGVDDSDNLEVRKVGSPTIFDYEPKAHWDIGTDLDIDRKSVV